MNTKRLVPAMALAMALVPATVAAQGADERIQSALERAEEAGIPVSLLESKRAEGEAKGVPMDRIADAMQRRMEGLSRAQEALADVPDVDANDLSVAADALESGVSEAVLAELAGTAPRERRAVAIAALGYLIEEAQVAPNQALQQVRDALARGPEALQNLPAQARGPGSVETPAGQAGPPAGIPAPGDAPSQGRPEGVEPPTGGGPPDDPSGAMPDIPPGS